jgi:hypothetical protein
MTNNYHQSIKASVPSAEVFDKINRVADWWTASFTGASGKIGDAFTVRFGETFVDFAVDDLVPARRIVWHVTDCNLHFIRDKKEWKDTHVVFDISPDGPATSVTMTHAGLVPGLECYDNCKGGWDFFVGKSLLKLLTENKGLPDQKNGSR